MSECVEYINRLYIPDGYEIDLLTVKDAKCMTKGYNEAMHSSDAKYKVYLHQDVFITNRYFICDILNIFNSDENIGLIGMVGYPKVSLNGVMWYERRVGAVPMYGASENFKDVSFEDYRYDINEGYTDVAVADGLMLITSHDIEWDEEFDGWDFYDATQSLRFRDAGYRAVAPVQRVPWFVHDDGYYLSVWNYNKYRHRFLKNYSDVIEVVNTSQKRILNPKKIAFIACVNNEQYYEEWVWYISKLNIPGYEVNVIPVRGAKSMAEGYNLAMERSNAKYKFYLHQDVFIIDEKLILECISEFEKNEKMGMIGVLGSDKYPEDAFFWNYWNLGGTYVVTPTMIKAYYAGEKADKCCKAVAIDGMFMATQYDVCWRMDIGLKWDYYDISQSLEFSRGGYEIGVISSEKLKIIHDCGITNVGNIDKSRQLFINSYWGYGWTYEVNTTYSVIHEESRRVEAKLRKLLSNGEYDKIEKFYRELDGDGGYALNTNSRLIILFAEVYRLETEARVNHSFIGRLENFEEMKEEFIGLSFAMRRAKYDDSNASAEALDELINKKGYSYAALERAAIRAIGDSEWYVKMTGR